MQQAFALLVILLSVAIRLVPHAWNIAPVASIGLFSGAYLSKRWAVLVPVAAMAIGDLFLGWVPENLFGWVAIALSGGIGFWLREKRSVGRLVAASVAASTLFYLISNFGVWVLGGHYYARDFQGLMNCYWAGVPFYRNTIIGDLLYTAILFGSYDAVRQWAAQRAAVPVSVSR